MRQINNDQENYVIGVAHHLSRNFGDNKSVECVYLLSYEDQNDNMNRYNLVIVLSEDIEAKEKEVLNKINEGFSEKEVLELFGGKFELFIDSDCELVGSTYGQRAKQRALVSSEILYDKDGSYKDLSNHFRENDNVEPYSNSFKFGIEEPKTLAR